VFAVQNLLIDVHQVEEWDFTPQALVEFFDKDVHGVAEKLVHFAKAALGIKGGVFEVFALEAEEGCDVVADELEEGGLAFGELSLGGDAGMFLHDPGLEVPADGGAPWGEGLVDAGGAADEGYEGGAFKNNLQETKAWASSENAKRIQAHLVCLAENLILLLRHYLDANENVRNEAEIKRRQERLDLAVDHVARNGGSVPIPLLKFQHLTQSSVKIIRWVAYLDVLARPVESSYRSVARILCLLMTANLGPRCLMKIRNADFLERTRARISVRGSGGCRPRARTRCTSTSGWRSFISC